MRRAVFLFYLVVPLAVLAALLFVGFARW